MKSNDNYDVDPRKDNPVFKEPSVQHFEMLKNKNEANQQHYFLFSTMSLKILQIKPVKKKKGGGGITFMEMNFVWHS